MFCTLILVGVAGFIGYLLLKYYYLEAQFINYGKDKAIFITGCDSGFGNLLAVKLARLGCSVYAGCLTEKGKTELKDQIQGCKGSLTTLSLNVTDQNSVDQAYQTVEESLEANSLKGLWGVVNNAGIVGASGPDDWLNVDDYQKVLDVNTLGVIRVTQRFKPLVKRTQGRIVTVASVAGRVPFPCSATYGVSKYAVEGYCDAIRLELKPFRVSVHILEPGFFATNLTEGGGIGQKMKTTFDKCDESVKREYGEKYIEEMVAATKKTMIQQCSPRLDFVVDSYTHALLSKYPRVRYNPGYDSKFFYLPLSFLSGEVQDIVLNGFMRLIGIPKPAASM